MAYAVPIVPFDTVDLLVRDIHWNRGFQLLDFFSESKGTVDNNVHMSRPSVYGGMTLSTTTSETYGRMKTDDELKERLSIHFKPIDTICSASSSFTRTVRCAIGPFDQPFVRRCNAAKGCVVMRPTESVLNHSRWLTTSRWQYSQANVGIGHGSQQFKPAQLSTTSECIS